AIRETLALLLERAEFRVAGIGAPDTLFQLSKVHREWPGPDVELQYPAASVLESGPAEADAHNFVPTALEETLGKFDAFSGFCDPDDPGPHTVLWRESELVLDVVVDFWTDSIADRQAIAAHIHELFSPSEGMYGVLVEGPELHFSRPVRITLLRSSEMDDAGRVVLNERRLHCTFRAETDIVSLRRASLLHPSTCPTVIDRKSVV